MLAQEFAGTNPSFLNAFQPKNIAVFSSYFGEQMGTRSKDSSRFKKTKAKQRWKWKKKKTRKKQRKKRYLREKARS